MKPLLSAIKVNHPDLNNFAIIPPDANDPKILHNLSRVNIIVGTNNSGKSRFLRALSKIEDPSFLIHSFKKDDISNIVNDLLQVFDQKIGAINSSVRDVSSFRKRIAEVRIPDFFTRETVQVRALIDLLNEMRNLAPRNVALTDSSVRYHSGDWQTQFSTPINEIGTIYLRKIELLVDGDKIGSVFSKPIQRTYIPILRGLRPFSKGPDNNLYRTRTENDYFDGRRFDNHSISTGIDLYDEIKTCLLGDLAQRKMIADFQEYLSKEFFENQSVAIIPKEGRDELALKIGLEKEQQIYNLGDGLQSLIIVTFAIFRAASQKDNFHHIFIEEPEVYIHPGLQRLLLSKMIDIENCQFFFTTHSNHFLDITLDFENISVFRITKFLDGSVDKEEVVPHFNVENVSSGDTKTLEILGVRDSSVFLSNCTLWVEGITDRMYIRHYLALYQKHRLEMDPAFTPFKEDSHFSFIEYSGSNLVHYDFSEDSGAERIKVRRVSKNVFVIADKDDKKDQKHKSLQEILGESYCSLNVREVENLITPETLNNVVDFFEKRKRNGNYKLRSNVRQSEYAQEYLGTFIQEKLLESGELKYSYTEDSGSGTIRDKVAFAKAVVASTTDWKHLSPTTKRLTERVYEFIQKHNS